MKPLTSDRQLTDLRFILQFILLLVSVAIQIMMTCKENVKLRITHHRTNFCHAHTFDLFGAVPELDICKDPSRSRSLHISMRRCSGMCWSDAVRHCNRNGMNCKKLKLVARVAAAAASYSAAANCLLRGCVIRTAHWADLFQKNAKVPQRRRIGNKPLLGRTRVHFRIRCRSTAAAAAAAPI